MGDNNNSESRPEAAGRRDGNIDFSRYATQQLEELRDTLDPAASPLNHAALLAELARRAEAAPQAPRWTGRFTRWSGLVGWISARLRRGPLYGAGAIEIHADQLVLSGRQRTWLGIGIERVLNVPLERVRNALVAAPGLRFEVRRRGWLASRVEFLPDDPAQAATIVQALPQARSARFEKYGASLLAFEQQLRARCRIAWLTPLLVLLNVASFIALWIQSGHLEGVLSAPLALLAANVGPLTLEGQWWRLLSALFVHADLWHLLLNMWALWNIGRLTERLFGRWTFLALYVGCGTIASLSSLLWDPARNSVGASGAIFALFGAFLAHLLRQRRAIPRGVFRSHWIPTLLFVGFSLYNGARAVGVDNAAHVGGLLSGLVLGLLLARSTAAQPGTALAATLRGAPALMLCLLWIAGSIFYVLWTRGPTPVAQQFAAANAWYLTGEARSNAAWRQLAGAVQAGVIADEDLGARVKKDVLPFWEEAAPRLESAVSALDGEQRRYVETIARFARLRREWAEAVISATSGRDREQMEVARSKDNEAIVVLAHLERLATRSNASRMTGGLVNLPLVQQWRTRLRGTHDECVSSPPGFAVDVAEDDLDTDSPAMLDSIGCQAQKYFTSGNFKELDAMLAAAAINLADLPAGESTLSGIVGGLRDLLDWSRASVEQYQRQLAMWRRAVPDSYYPDLMEVELYQAWAWSARGRGSSTQVTPQAWALFQIRNEMAQAALDDLPVSGRQDPMWCDTAMRLRHDRAHEPDEIEDIFHQCSSRWPAYLSPYRAMLRALMPRWYGSTEEVDAFIGKLVDAEPEERRDALYARLYWMYANLERDDINIFTEAAADWTRVDKGFDRLQERYPESDLVLNAHARFACLADDDVTYRLLRKQMSGRKSATAWSLKTTRSGCDTQLR